MSAVISLYLFSPTLCADTFTDWLFFQGAGGDVKRKGQQDPYAYLPLSSVGAKKKGAAGVKYSITGKR